MFDIVFNLDPQYTNTNRRELYTIAWLYAVENPRGIVDPLRLISATNIQTMSGMEIEMEMKMETGVKRDTPDGGEQVLPPEKKTKGTAATVDIQACTHYLLKLNDFSNFIFDWLEVKDSRGHREIAIQYDEDMFKRHLHFKGPEYFRLRTRLKPIREVHIGCISSEHNSARKLNELVFDIDLNDYEGYRFCECKGMKKACSKCWIFMEAAMTIINEVLLHSFGLKHVYWFFSGRRGIHGWVMDRQCLSYDKRTRQAIARYIRFAKPKNLLFENGSFLNPIPARVRYMFLVYYNTLEPYFVKYLKVHDPWNGDDNKLFSELLKILFKSDVRQGLSERKGHEASSYEMWSWLKSQAKAGRICETVLDRIVIKYMAPRLDINVTTQIDHLIKAPFSVHSKTGNVCIYIDPLDDTAFDPSDPRMNVSNILHGNNGARMYIQGKMRSLLSHKSQWMNQGEETQEEEEEEVVLRPADRLVRNW
jgi:DNA primase small subunit